MWKQIVRAKYRRKRPIKEKNRYFKLGILRKGNHIPMPPVGLQNILRELQVKNCINEGGQGTRLEDQSVLREGRELAQEENKVRRGPCSEQRLRNAGLNGRPLNTDLSYVASLAT